MTIALFATGDELIDGNTLNTNHHVLAAAIASEGLPLGLHLTCRDNEQTMINCLRFLTEDHDTIIITGGLGPTSDDLTRFALARFLDLPLIEHPEAIQHVQSRVKAAFLAMNPGNRQQALFPSDATLLPNPYGTAMGCYLVRGNKRFVLLPGPPRECMPMFQTSVLPLLHPLQHSEQVLLKWRLFGVSESQIAEKLELALAEIDCQMGYRLEIPYVEFKVRCHPRDEISVNQTINPLVAPFIISPVEQRASDCLRQKINSLAQSITIVDEVTRGLLQTLLQQPTNHHYLFFNSIKNNAFMFRLSGLDDYWSQTPSTGSTQLTIDFQIDGKEGSETHSIPYFNPQVVLSFAAEWLSFRLLMIIEQHE